jgi:hypothetical protein
MAQRAPLPEKRWSRAVARAAARRFALLVAGAAGVTALVSLAIGLPSGSSLSRSLSVGLYATGCLAIVAGFALGLPGRRRDDAISDSALFVALGFVLLALGILADARYPLI